MAVDAITATPYLGFGSLTPMIDTAREHGKGVFVLALTSNPEAPAFQHARTEAGQTVAGTVLDELRTLNSAAAPIGSLGAVVGATIADTAEDLAINGPLLVPGIGAQGGTADDVRRIFGDVIDLVLPASSREILAAGPDAGALHAAVGRSLDAFTALRGGR
jgi:orotidine-5'-phosphate decarboxylase